MSMIGNFKSCSEEKLKELLEKPDSIEGFLYPEEFVENDPTEIDLDKTWQAIHFLLTDSPWEGNGPLNFIMGGKEIGDIDVGYGPARSFTSEQVKEISAALEKVNESELKNKFSSDEFNENDIYPSIWDESVEECIEGYVLPYYRELKEFIKNASNSSQAIITYIN